MRTRDHETKRTRDHETKRPRDQETKTPSDQETKDHEQREERNSGLTYQRKEQAKGQCRSNVVGCRIGLNQFD